MNENNRNLKIISAEREYPQGGSGVFDLGKYADGTRPSHGTQRLKMTLEDNSVEYMEYYGDEITIMPGEVQGKTLSEAWDVYSAKDTAYLRG